MKKKISFPSDIVQFEWEDVLDKEEIVRGGFGAVYRATFSNMPLVVKRLHARDEESTKELLKGAKLLVSLKHKNIVKLKAICTSDSLFSISVHAVADNHIRQTPGGCLPCIFVSSQKYILTSSMG